MKNEKIILWQTHFSKLDDELFFSYIKTYLGKIQTPYNKQDLIEKLAAFFISGEHQKTIFSLLDESEKKIIAAVMLLPKPTFDNLAVFFANEYTRLSLSEKFKNLTERLLVYKTDFESEYLFFVNPFLEPLFQSFSRIAFSIPMKHNVKKNNAPSFFESTVAGLLSYIAFHPDMCKQDGSFKKKVSQELSKIFLTESKTLQIIFHAFLNLGLAVFKKSDGEKTTDEIVIDKIKVKTFASLPAGEEAAFIVAASAMRLSREVLQKNASLFLSLAVQIKNSLITKQSMIRASFFCAAGDEKKITRLSRILSHEPKKNADVLFSTLIDNAATLSLLHKSGETENHETLFSFDDVFFKEKNKDEKIFFIDATFSIRTKPDTSLDLLFPFLFSLEIKKCEASLEFALTKKAATNFFASGKNADEFILLLKNASLYEFEKNIESEIREWFTSYNRAKLYKGFVLVLDEKTNTRFLRNGYAKKYAIQKIAENTYVLAAQTEKDAKKILNDLGMPELRTMEGKIRETQRYVFPQLEKTLANQIPQTDSNLENEKKPHRNNSSEKHLLAKLREKNFSKTDEFFFREKIAHKIIISEEQLSLDYLSEEIIEARGFDFLGKVHLVETAIKNGDLLELIFADKDDKRQKFFCMPIEIEKDENDALVNVRLADGNEKKFSIRLAKKIKRIHRAHGFGTART